MTSVSVVLPTLNEQAYLRDCLDSLVAQDFAGIDEILVVDGRSHDNTRSIAERFAPLVRVVDNPGVTAASAMNVGLAEARNDLIVRADAHTLYAPDYVSSSVRALESSGADWVGGTMRPAGATAFARSVAAVTSSPFGVGPGRFHYATEEQDAETVYLGSFDRRIVTEVGGYDAEHIQWAAEDQELNYRLRKSGRRIRLVPAVRSWYFPRDTPRSLWRQYFNYGMCKASTLAKHRTLPYWRPLAPAILVAGLVGAALSGAAARRPVLGLVPAAGYLAATGAVAIKLASGPGVHPHRSWLALLICHVSYGLGFWSGVTRIVTGRPFDARPKARR